MAITENFRPEYEEYQHQPPVTINQYRMSVPFNVYLRQNQQEKSNSSSSTIKLSNKGNQSLSTSTIVETVIDTVEEDTSVKEEEIKVKEESKGENSVKEEGEIDNKDYIQVEDDKSYQSYVSKEDSTMSPSSWSSSSSHQRGRGGRRRSSHRDGRGGRGRSSRHSGQGGRRRYDRSERLSQRLGRSEQLARAHSAEIQRIRASKQLSSQQLAQACVDALVAKARQAENPKYK